ncbi:PREDICTED: putative uncharacterized protein encoded by LINC00269-like [Chrysochloris asiatica]|uniref:Uncharacterized protein n=1 Tax=Chrysochloris asiatica TaxID=185453 RepID=A0A9B0U157_CHRAS|nr:PREDICTED: putative uncharacterized protein encoded by LINC00269-like [Chrysochloris asiatica]
MPNLVGTPDQHSALQPKTPGLRYPPASASGVAGITGARHHARLAQQLQAESRASSCALRQIGLAGKKGAVSVSVETEKSHYSPELLDSSDPPASASRVAGTTGARHHARRL